MLTLQGLSKSYGGGEFAVHDLSLEVPAGRIASLLGHNGAGKSTTLKIAAGILAPTAGSVCVDGHRLSNESQDIALERRRLVGFLPEDAQLLDYMTPGEFLRFVGHLYGINDEGALTRRIAALVQTFALEESAERLIRELSAGQRRRVSILAAVLNHPRLLILDEPTNFLDPIGLRILKDYLLDLRAEGCAVLLATHRLDVAEQLSDTVVVIDHGVEIFQGALPDLRAKFMSLTREPSLENLYSALLGH